MQDETTRRNLVAGVTGPQIVIPLALIRAVNRHLPTAVMAQQAAFLSALKRDEDGWFHLPQLGQANPEGNFFERIGSWEALGLGQKRRIAKIRDRLQAIGVLETKRSTFGARELYRVNQAAFLELIGEGGTAFTQQDASQGVSEYDIAAGAYGPTVAIPLTMLRVVGNDIQAAMMLRQAAFLTGLSGERDGWFHLPQTGEADLNGNLFQQIGSWEAIGLGDVRRQREIRKTLEGFDLIETKRAGQPAKTFYRVKLGNFWRLMEEGGASLTPGNSGESIDSKPATAPSDPDCAKTHFLNVQNCDSDQSQIVQKRTSRVCKSAVLDCAKTHFSYQREPENNKESSSPQPPLPTEREQAPAEPTNADDDFSGEVFDRLVAHLQRGGIKNPRGYISHSLTAEGIRVTRQRIDAVMAAVKQREERNRGEEVWKAVRRSLSDQIIEAMADKDTWGKALNRDPNAPEAKRLFDQAEQTLSVLAPKLHALDEARQLGENIIDVCRRLDLTPF